VTRQAVRTREAAGDSRSPGDACPSYSRYHNIQQQPQEGSVSDRRCRVVPEVVVVRRRVFGVLGIWKGEGWGEGGSKGVSLQAT
jgi:hypothetical protein